MSPWDTAWEAAAAALDTSIILQYLLKIDSDSLLHITYKVVLLVKLLLIDFKFSRSRIALGSPDIP